MDRGGRVAGSLTARLDGALADVVFFARRKLLAWARRRANRYNPHPDLPLDRRPVLGIVWRKCTAFVSSLRPVRGIGLVGSVALIGGAALYGARFNDNTGEPRKVIGAAIDMAANSVGFQLAAVHLSGERLVSREEIFALCGLSEHTSVLFFNAEAARERLKAQPWIKEATVKKLYPDRLQIAIVEREPYALWQRDGRIAVIDADGTVIANYLDPRFQTLPLVVGAGANERAREILTVLEALPTVMRQTRAAVLVGERRWNLKLNNGIDVRLPEEGVLEAAKRLAALDAQQRLMSRDVASIDMRLADKVMLRLSDDAFSARDAALKERVRTKKKGGEI